MAVRYTLCQPLLEWEYVAELEHIKAGDLHRLERYHLECGKKVEAIVTSCTLTSKWAIPLPGGYDCTWYKPSTLFPRNNPVNTTKFHIPNPESEARLHSWLQQPKSTSKLLIANLPMNLSTWCLMTTKNIQMSWNIRG